jgi:Trk-type K+ transport system membrane component
MLNNGRYINLLLLAFFATMLLFVLLVNRLYNQYTYNQTFHEQLVQEQLLKPVEEPVEEIN